jgi:hypothetical protein
MDKVHKPIITQSLLSAYNKEYKNIREWVPSGVRTGDICSPALRYYVLLFFISFSKFTRGTDCLLRQQSLFYLDLFSFAFLMLKQRKDETKRFLVHVSF